MKEKDIYQYGKILDGIAEVIGKENLIVRRFDAESWRDGSIIHDFMHEIGIDVTPEFHELEKNANLSLDKNTTEIKRILNQEESFTMKEISYMGKFLKKISENYIQKDHTEMLAKEELQQFLKKYETENERIAREYIGDGHPLFSNEVKDSGSIPASANALFVILFFITVYSVLDFLKSALKLVTSSTFIPLYVC